MTSSEAQKLEAVVACGVRRAMSESKGDTNDMTSPGTLDFIASLPHIDERRR